MAQRAFLHVGTMKSGTSYLQSLWWRHRATLAERGLLLPGGDIGAHFSSALLVCERHDRLTPERREVWGQLCEEVSEWPGDALISHEAFSAATTEQAARALRDLARGTDELHLLVTARDLARQLPSHWQQKVKQHCSTSLDDYWLEVQQEAADHEFWRYQDVPAIAERWSQGVPPERVHLVVLPPTAPRDWLWHQVCGLIGVDTTGMDRDSRRPNESLGIAEVEVMRRMHAAASSGERDFDLSRLAKGFFARQVVMPAGSGDPFVITPKMHAWALERGAATVAELRSRGYDVIGDLDDLRPGGDPPSGRTPDDVTEAEVAEVAVGALARLLSHEKKQRAEIERLRARARRPSRRRSTPTPVTSTSRDTRLGRLLGRGRRS